MATKWPDKRRLIGTKISRVDGPDKATGKARYSFDIHREGLLHAAILRCPHAHAKIKSIDTTAAEKVPGFKALHLIAKEGQELFYAGDEVLAIAADTEEHCKDALRACKVDYQELPHQVKEEDALRDDKKTTPPFGPRREVENRRPAIEREAGNIAQALQDADVKHEGSYGVPTICHQCLESHGLVAEWDKDGEGLTVWASTQAVTGTAVQLAQRFRIPVGKVKCITRYMGGGFGSKFGPDVQGFVCAELARKAMAPVKLMLDRDEEVTVGGTRPSAHGKVTIGAKKDGTIVAYQIDCHGTPGTATSRTVGPLPYVYPFPNVKERFTVVRTNTQQQRAMRAPGHPQSCFLTDCAIDDLAAKLQMDPLQVRLKNIPQNDAAAQQNAPQSLAALRGTIYSRQIEIAAALSDWKKKWHPPGADKGVVKRGLGMALHTWGGQASPQPNECTVTISRDGSVLARSSTQDLGTAQRTVTAIVVAEILGLKPEDITVEIGESPYGMSSGSGGSTTCPSQAPATLQAAAAARDDFLDTIAKRLESDKDDLRLENGKVVDKKRDKSWAWKEACAKLGMDVVRASGSWRFNDSVVPENRGISNTGVGGVQVAEVLVDTETGQVRCTKVVAVQDCGLVVNKLGCESQVAGGVIMGLNYALFEERVMDRTTGRQLNADMEFYKLGGIKDMPDIVVHMHDMPERGVIGIGEPPTISTHAAIGNAIFNALGVRVPNTPFSPQNVLAALSKKGGKSS
jgi:xanthine dehydrogenase YagR molybdenum-binding subunit